MNTDFIKKAKDRKLEVIYGYEMLLGQATRAFEIWHGMKAPYNAMKKSIVRRILMAKVKATIHGAVSIVSAIANKKGATLGISLKVEAVVETSEGKGIVIQSENKSLSSRLINKTVEKIISKKDLEKNKITITLTSEIPTGYGLKSSSAISSVVALGCAKIFKPKLTDQQIILAGVDASIETKVSITGAYDDACSCYYGGFNVTDNGKRNRVHFEKAPTNLIAIIFIPKNRKRGNIKKLKILSPMFNNAWELAKREKILGIYDN